VAEAVVSNLDEARDRDLIRRVAERDEAAFRELFRHYGPLAKGLALRLARHQFMAEEIVQEAFLALWRKPDAYRTELGSVRGWLMATVHHRAVDAVRREEAQRRRSRDWEPEQQVEEDVGDTVVEEAEAAESKTRVRVALGEIPPEQRQILELMYFQGKSQSMIAEELDLPLGTVKSRTLLGMRRLRTSFVGGAKVEGSE
jgi:RNA polymerase sigma-70 factor (ECF subfamily)